MTVPVGRHGRYRWALLTAAWGLYVGFGLVSSSLAPLVGTIADDLGLSRAQMGTVLGAWPLVYLVVAVPVGRLLGRIGLRWGLAVGIGLVCVSGLLRSLATGWGGLFAAVAVFGLGGPLISIGTPALVSGWFTGDARGPTTGAAVSGPVVAPSCRSWPPTRCSCRSPATGGGWWCCSTPPERRWPGSCGWR
ncbi:MAG: MFS transporter [Acidimicrobiales bacterium]